MAGYRPLIRMCLASRCRCERCGTIGSGSLERFVARKLAKEAKAKGREPIEREDDDA